MTPTRIARDVSTVAVAGIAAWSSWSHMVAVALKFGERPEVAYVLPLSVDGMLVVASAVMMEDKHARRKVRWSARIAFAAGVATSVAANIAAAQPSLGARIVAAWPAIALLLVVEMLTRSEPTPHESHRASGTAYQQTLPAAGSVSRPAPSHPPNIVLPEAKPEALRTAVAERSATSQAPTSTRQRRTRRTPMTGRAERTVDVVARLRAERPQASMTELALAAGVSERHLRRLVAGESGTAAARKV
ncbi:MULTISPECIES: DUF2637 domain-containing protein [unclassified Micromonospora]|uniref:DUF2637 domain-containing protein n=1 Tax=unclassified Micromonospora TaxID=2617518 RepID=UPI003A869664